MTLNASFVKVPITPPIGLRLGGFAHRMASPSRFIHGDLYARVLLASSRMGELALVQLDLLGLYSSDVELIRGIVSKRLGIKAGDVAVMATHTHSSPETVIPMWVNTFPYTREERALYNQWFNGLLSRLEESLEGGPIHEPKGVRVKVGELDAAESGRLCVSRLTGGYVSVNIQAVLIETRNGLGRVILYSHPCHPTCNMDLGVSPDYPGEVHSALTSSGIEPMFMPGFMGDVTPSVRGINCISNLGNSISRAILGGMVKLSEVNNDEVWVRVKRINVPLRQPPPLARAKARFEELYGKANELGLIRREPIEDLWRGLNERWVRDRELALKAKLLLDLLYADEEYELAKGNAEWEAAELGVVKLGDITMVTVPGEPFTGTLNTIKARLSGKASGASMNIIGVGYTNGYIGYIPTREAFRLGSYETRLARWSRVAEGADDLIASEILSLLT